MYRLFLKDFWILSISVVSANDSISLDFFLALLLSFQNKGSAFFFQDRFGQHEKKIRIVKFKSMTDEKDEEGNLLPDNQRITRLGRFVRKWSLDELPPVIQCFKGGYESHRSSSPSF